MTNILYKGLIGRQDVYYGDIDRYPETYARRASLGTVNMTKIPDLFKGRFAQYYGAKGDGSADDTAALNAALAVGGAIELVARPGGCFLVSDKLLATAPGYLFSRTGAEIRQTTANKGGVEVTTSTWGISGVKLTGPQYAASKANENAIYAHGGSSSSYISNIFIDRCILSNWGQNAIMLQFVSDWRTYWNEIYNLWYAGIIAYSSIRGTVSKNSINNVIASTNAYGIELTREENDSLVTHPRSGYVNVSDNLVRNVTNWKAYGAHGAEYVNFNGNIAYGCAIGIGVGACDNGSNVSTFAPLNVSVTGNVLNSGVTDGTASFGIFFTGADDVQSGTGTVSGNTINGFGTDANALGNSLYAHNTNGLSINGNSIVKGARYGIYLGDNSVGTSIVGNSIHDMWSEDLTVPTGIYANGTDSSVTIDGNTFTKGDSAATYTFAHGRAITIGNQANNDVRVGTNYSTGVKTLLLDSGDKAAKINYSVTTTAGTGEDDLNTFVIPAATIGIAGGIRVTAAGTKTGANDNKTIKFYFGATAITFHAAANNTNDWKFEATIFNTATNSQQISWTGWDGATPLQGYDTASIDTTADVTIKVTGECANAGDAILQKIFYVERL